MDRDDNIVGLLVGAISVNHQMIHDALERQLADNSITQLVDETGLVIVSTDSTRVLRQLPYREAILDAVRTHSRTKHNGI